MRTFIAALLCLMVWSPMVLSACAADRPNVMLIMTDDQGYGTSGGHTIFNAGMKGHKGSVYEGGHRVPCFIYWPAGGLNNPVDVDRLTAHIDLLPTLIE